MEIFKKNKNVFLICFLVVFFIIMFLPVYSVSSVGSVSVYANTLGWHVVLIFMPLLLWLCRFAIKEEFLQSQKMLVTVMPFVPSGAAFLYLLVSLIRLGSVKKDLGFYSDAVGMGVGFWLYLIWFLCYTAFVVVVLVLKEKPSWVCSQCGTTNYGAFCTQCGSKSDSFGGFNQ